MLEAIQPQMPQTKPTSSEQLHGTQSSTPQIDPLVAVKNGLLQTAVYPWK